LNVVLQVAQDLTSIGFIALGAATVYQWYRYRGRAQAMLAWALGLLALAAAIGRIQTVTGTSAFVSVISLISFLGSGYFVLMFRDAFLPLRPIARRAATILLIVASALAVASATVLAHANATLTSGITLLLVLAWAAFIGEPVVRFWVASRKQPSVQRTRMRALSFGFAALVAILLVAVLGGRALQNPVATLLIQLVAMITVPLIYVSFAPPSLLRRIWRMGEENKLRAAIQDLLIFSPGPQALAEQAAGWAIRMLGAQAAFIVDPTGKVMASRNISVDGTRDLLARKGDQERGSFPGPGGATVMVAPLRLTEGTGFLGVLSGPFTPIFGNDEINQLEGYASSVAAGLERTRVTERIAAIEKHKSQFLNLASHELRGPLTVIRGYGSMLQAGLLGDLNDRGRKAAPVMMAKILEMNALIEQMIEAARLEDGGLLIKPEEADLRAIASAAVAKLEPVLDERHHIVLKSPSRPVRVMVDAERVTTIVTNLIDNAVKYSPDGGEVTVMVTTGGGVARLGVKDTGIGIARDDLPILFTRFGRVSNSSTDHFPGTGLGLFLGRQLARLQGGEITVDSVPGEGSTFTLHLPIAERVDRATVPELSPSRLSAEAAGLR
jgi:signal transduction histidine kinase